MRIKLTSIWVLGALAMCAASARAATIRSGSSYGSESSSCLANNQMQAETVNDSPESSCVGVVSLSPITVGGLQDPAQVQQFTFYGSATDEGVIDLVDLGPITSSSASFSLPLIDTSLETGVFACNRPRGDDNGTGTGNPVTDTTLTDGGDSVTNVACTEYDFAALVSECLPGMSSCVTPPGTVTFSVSPGDSAGSDLVVYTLDGNLGTVTTPEPSSFALLGWTLVPLLLFTRRRLRA